MIKRKNHVAIFIVLILSVISVMYIGVTGAVFHSSNDTNINITLAKFDVQVEWDTNIEDVKLTKDANSVDLDFRVVNHGDVNALFYIKVKLPSIGIDLSAKLNNEEPYSYEDGGSTLVFRNTSLTDLQWFLSMGASVNYTLTLSTDDFGLFDVNLNDIKIVVQASQRQPA